MRPHRSYKPFTPPPACYEAMYAVNYRLAFECNLMWMCLNARNLISILHDKRLVVTIVTLSRPKHYNTHITMLLQTLSQWLPLTLWIRPCFGWVRRAAYSGCFDPRKIFYEKIVSGHLHQGSHSPNSPRAGVCFTLLITLLRTLIMFNFRSGSLIFC